MDDVSAAESRDEVAGDGVRVSGWCVFGFQVYLRPKDSGVCVKEAGHKDESWGLPRGRTSLSSYPAPLG